ncbi:tripartite tricarboxylate transporter TctB family protein [Moraxella nasovis]|uniref:tripartite tricarboxylate transporter TctB family protein n=1 Tax=Moraxella nasovis TaxID=2904121 RepID=UPI001F612689|nr:tripartite tricarboxylate transporter TctB family protein [Moraxella nasovis]UNU73800.1 tripartite tricarboxylate transporter TctB family protein [Moraxella nasovis]
MIERIFSGLLACTCLIMLYMAWGYTAAIAYDPIGPRPYPVMLLVLLAILTGIIALRPARFADKVKMGLSAPIIKHLVVCTVALTLYAILFEVLGYIIATTLMAWALGILFGGSWIKAFVSSAVIAIASFFLFNGPLEVSLPAGPLAFLVG